MIKENLILPISVSSSRRHRIISLQTYYNLKKGKPGSPDFGNLDG
jgi:hypothetical protein